MRASDRAYATLRTEILEWQLAPGTVLAEVEQAARLGVSRTPLREALARLSADGLVESLPGRGVVVAEASADSAAELFEVRIALETQAAALAAQRRDPAVFERLRHDPAFHDAAYDPPFSDFNLVIDNHGTAVNVTVAKATARIKFRRSRSIDYSGIEAAVKDAAARAGVTLTEKREGTPPELPADHPLIALGVAATGQAACTAPYGTDASELQDLAPCMVLGPGTIATAHTPHECVAVADLAAAVPLFRRILAAR